MSSHFFIHIFVGIFYVQLEGAFTVITLLISNVLNAIP